MLTCATATFQRGCTDSLTDSDSDLAFSPHSLIFLFFPPGSFTLSVSPAVVVESQSALGEKGDCCMQSQAREGKDEDTEIGEEKRRVK